MDALITWRWRVVTFLVAAILMMFNVGARSLNNDDEIDMHLNRLNKPAIRSIKLEDGEIVDCVDIYKQPAFDDPDLKDHKIIKSPSFAIKTGNIANKSRQRSIFQSAWQKSEGCPEGTIPIRRVQKSDILRAYSSKDIGRKIVSGGQVERAGITLYNDGPYIGTKSCISMWGVSVEPNEWSQVASEVSDGHDRDNNKIILEAGWAVNPRVFGDSKTRFFTYWTMDGYKNTGCYNLMCSGFVQTADYHVLGAAINPLSTYEGEQFCFNTSIFKDKSNAVWWLLIDDDPVGYWPMRLFKKHGGVPFEAASTVKWIGSVLNTNKGGRHTTTEMGNGHYSNEGWQKAACVDEIQVLKDNNDGFYQPTPTLWVGFADNALCYDFYIEDDLNLFLGGPGRGHFCQ